MKKVVLVALLALAGCATGYSSKGLTGGFSETRMGERVYQVRFEGNGLVTQERVSAFLLRRCAELTLENGFRWFAIANQDGGATVSGASGWIVSYPHREATIRFLDKESDDPGPLDSVFIIRETDKRAGGKLSEKARQTLATFGAAEGYSVSTVNAVISNRSPVGVLPTRSSARPT